MVRRSSDVVAGVMRKLGRVLAALEAQPTPEGTLRSRAEALLEEAAGMPVALLVANNSGRYVDVNELATRLTGYSRAELLRRSVWDLTPKPSVSDGRRMWREFLNAGHMAGKYPLCRQGGGRIEADFRAWANVLPGLHVSALATPALVRGKAPAARPKKR